MSCILNNVTHLICSISRNLSHVVAFMNYPFPLLLDPDLPRPLDPRPLDPDLPRPLDPRPLDPDLPRPRDLFLLPSGAPLCFFPSARFWKVLPITPAKASAHGISTAEFRVTRPVPLHSLLMRLPRSPTTANTNTKTTPCS